MITLATLSTATAQQVFDQVVTHLLTQEQKCEMTGVDGSKQCRYRHKDLKCAAGCLIGDDEYDPKFEGCDWHGLKYEGTVPDEHEYLISQLQNVHDRFPVDRWAEQLTLIAQQRELTLPPICQTS